MNRRAEGLSFLGDVGYRVAKWAALAFALVVALGALASVGMVLMVLSPWYTTTGFDVSPAEANATIHQRFAIPATAWDVRYITSPRVSFVTFHVEPTEFDAWARSRGFGVTALDHDHPGLPFTLDAAGDRHFDDVFIEEGARFEESGRCGMAGVYDPRRRLCSAIFSCK